ncbi:unnamed protein product [Hermetia illucens]|uniref:Uncharacterized protein n=1 Tax=Hermetia illucens TaxID=343691 RepID=A0A7R8Z5P0_HERIL|nr:unnamed protein product [Hermetia illucens]
MHYLNYAVCFVLFFVNCSAQLHFHHRNSDASLLRILQIDKTKGFVAPFDNNIKTLSVGRNGHIYPVSSEFGPDQKDRLAERQQDTISTRHNISMLDDSKVLTSTSLPDSAAALGRNGRSFHDIIRLKRISRQELLRNLDRNYNNINEEKKDNRYEHANTQVEETVLFSPRTFSSSQLNFNRFDSTLDSARTDFDLLRTALPRPIPNGGMLSQLISWLSYLRPVNNRAIPYAPINQELQQIRPKVRRISTHNLSLLRGRENFASGMPQLLLQRRQRQYLPVYDNIHQLTKRQLAPLRQFQRLTMPVIDVPKPKNSNVSAEKPIEKKTPA